MQNELIHETSPYLLQHAHNPVHWQIWGDKAFAAAKAQNKPILVSIGYATCHWCHVMERESFENQQTADFMNQHFINIKLDREERPDIDSVMMEVVQMISGNGGWPLNCFLLPDGRPFFAGTYFPPEPRYGRTSWLQLLDNIQKAFHQRPEEVASQAEQIYQYLHKSEQAFSKPKQQNMPFSPATDAASSLASVDFFQTAFYQLRDSFDRYYGGFGNAPKFPASFALRFCMNYSHFLGQAEGREQAHFSLYRMAQAGIYDQAGGGFARYATDQGWNIPHFEKMLYDNALLLIAYAQAYAQIGQTNEYSRRFAEVCAQTFDFLQREMRAPMGLYYSAIDADSEGQEGKFYTWDLAELAGLLSGEELDLLQKLMDLSPNGNWEHRNILYFNRSLADYCLQSGADFHTAQQLLQAGYQKLLTARAARIRPITDDKIMLDWNALLVVAFCHLYRTFQNPSYYQAAQTAIDALLTLFVREAGQLPLYHTYKNGQGKNSAFLDDYAFLVAACLDFYQISLDKNYLRKAQQYTELIIAQFADEQDGLFYFTEQGADILIRRKDLYDNATPSANSVMAQNLLLLAILLDRPDYQQKAEKMLNTMAETAQKFPQSFSNWLNAGFLLSQGWKEIVVVGADYQQIIAAIQPLHIPNAIIVGAAQKDETLPLLADKEAVEGQTLIYLCQQYACQKPVATVAELLELL